MAGRKFSKDTKAKINAAFEALSKLFSEIEAEDEARSDEAKEARRVLQEAANLGNWLESRIHLAFTQIADDMFGNGKVTRDERIALSSAIGEALTSFNATIAAAVPSIYDREPWRDAPEPEDMSEAATLEGEFIPLVEAAVRRDGTIPIKIIAPGWGASGYYPADVLERDGPKVFGKGLKSFWNHATATEEAQRPEGDLNALAAELISDARYLADGPKGAGLYADAKVFGPYKEAVNELAKHIGVSIRASGRAVQGEAEGRKGPIVQQLTSAKSVDFVTVPGAGGQIIDMFEAARPQPSSVHKEDQVNEKEFKEALAAVQQENARLKEAMLLRDARDFVSRTVAKASIPEITKDRLIESLSANPPVKDGALDRDAYATQIQEAVTQEVKYLTEAAGYGSGRIEGMGGSGAGVPDYKPEEIEERIAKNLQRLGFSESAAKRGAAMGRDH